MPRADYPDEQRCTAKCKSTGNRCRRERMHGKRVCWVHGGASPRGFAHPNTRTGKRSRDLPTRLASRYAEALSDPELLTLNREVALFRARLDELLERLPEGGGLGAIGRIRNAFKDMLAASKAGDSAAASAAVDELADAIGSANQDYQLWADIRETAVVLKSLGESERKRLVEADLVVNVKDMMQFVGVVVAVLKDRIKDRDTLSLVQRDLSKLLEKNAEVVDG